ncbi:MAG: restriction endonuclease subunit M [Bacteroidales bacterium]|nr:restriction endonuclease subunit M [Bacteroidales bacterium]
MKAQGVDISENDILGEVEGLLQTLLADRTLSEDGEQVNISWMTHDYEHLGEGYGYHDQIRAENITGEGKSEIIRPRCQKNKEKQTERVKKMAEVFTPAWVCNYQCNLVDEGWFVEGKEINVMSEDLRTWEPTKEKVEFAGGKTWEDYVLSNRIEITCGEAPYLVSRADVVTGEPIEVPRRMGLLDRKLRIVGENTVGESEWIEWARRAVESTYGFEWSGDSLLLAREAFLLTTIEHYEYLFGKPFPKGELMSFAERTSWNLWQMDGLRSVIPCSCHTTEVVEKSLLGEAIVSKPCEGCRRGYGLATMKYHNGVYCKIMDWKTGQVVRFVDTMRIDENAEKWNRKSTRRTKKQ